MHRCIGGFSSGAGRMSIMVYEAGIKEGIVAQFAFHFDGRRCTGCMTCQLACADYHGLTGDFWYRRVCEFGGGSWTQGEDGTWTTDAFASYVSTACNHCEDPACVQVCRVGAMRKDSETGLVSVDEARCAGCGRCCEVCPHDAPKIDRKKGCCTKCDGCQDRVAQGAKPICVESCPLGALDFGRVE